MKHLTLVAAVFAFVCLPVQGFTANQSPMQPTVNFTGVAKEAIPAVVSIKVKAEMPGRSNYYFNGREIQPDDHSDMFSDPFFERFFGGSSKRRPSQPKVQTAQGSGFIASRDGYVITNGHVVDKATEITVVLNDGRELPGKVIGIDPNTDIAILKIDANNLPFLSLGNSENLEVGQWVMAIGNPLGLQESVSVGVVSAKGRNNLDLARVEDFIQTDAAINRGNSGGPLLNLQGEVIGMNTAIVSNMGTGGYMGIGFAIPSNLIGYVMKELIDNGSVSRGFMGVTLQQVTNDLAQAFGLDKIEGALIAEVTEGSPAEAAGLKSGDVVIAYNQKKVSNVAALRNAVSLMKPGSKLDLTILRNGKKMNVSMTVGTYPEDGAVTIAPSNAHKLGIEVQPLTRELAQKMGVVNLDGVVIKKIQSGSAAAMGGLREGALIVAVNHKEIKSVEEYREAMKQADPKKPILFLVKQDAFMHFVSIRTE